MHRKMDGDASKDGADGMPFDAFAFACVDEMHEMHAHAAHAARYDTYTQHY